MVCNVGSDQTTYLFNANSTTLSSSPDDVSFVVTDSTPMPFSTAPSSTSITVDSAPSVTLTPLSNSIKIGQPIQFTANIPASWGGPFTADLIYNGNVVATNSSTSSNVVTFSYTPNDLGQLSFSASAVYTSPTQYYLFSSLPSVVAVNPVLTGTAANVVVNIPSNTPVSFNYSEADAVLTVTSSNSVTADVSIADVSSNFTSLPTAAFTTFSKIVLLDFNVTTSSATNATYQVTIDVACGSNTAPYELLNGIWTALPYTTTATNPAACTVSFDIPADPVVGLFASAVTSTSTSAGSAGGGGGGGGGGTQKPVVSRTGNGYQVSNLAQLNTFSLTLGSPISGVENFITPTGAGVSLNGTSYSLSLDTPVQIGSNATANRYVNLTGISYIPLQQTVTLEIYSVPLIATPIQAPVQTNSTSTNSTVTPYVQPTTTVQPNSTVTAPSSVAASSQQPSYLMPAVAVVALIVVACGVGYRLRKRPKSPKKA